MKVRLLLFLVLANIGLLKAQINESFQTLNAWQADTSQWTISNEMLQSNYKIINSNFELSASNALATNCVWKLNCTLKFSTSSLNYVDFYLIADSNIVSKSQNAYFVRIGSTVDDICLYKKWGNTITKLIDGADGRSQTSSSNNQIQLKIIRNGTSDWTLLTDNESNGNNYQLEGKCVDSSYTNTKFVGLQIHQSTASFVGKHFFDNLIIETIAQDSLHNIIVPTNVIAKGDVILSEILFNPLPNGADFVELYNNSTKEILLADLMLANEKGDTISFKSSNKIIYPNGYLAISVDSNNIHQNYPYYVRKKIFQAKIPSMNDDAGHVALLNSNKILLDEFSYSEKLHFSLITNNEGVSLEKIDLTQSSENSNWHSAASNIGYASPGNTNSQNLSNALNSNQSFSTNTKVFSPDEDGNNDVVLLQYQLPKLGSTASIYVYNTAGEMVKQLANNHLLSTNGVYQWDGITANGEKAHNGYYLIKVDMLHTDGNNEIAEIAVVLWSK